MVKISVPERMEVGLNKFFNLEENQFEELLKSLSNAEVSLTPEKTIKDSLVATTGFTPVVVSEISQSIISLLLFGVRADEDKDELVTNIIETLKESELEVSNYSEEQYAVMEKRLAELFNLDNIILSSKAVRLKFEYEKLFNRAKVLTEIVPIFGNNVEESPKAAIITHQLGITYFQHNKVKEFHLRMDEEELVQLITALQRAQKKSKSTREFLSSTKITYIKDE